MKNVHKKLELITNVAIIIVSVLFATVLVSRFFNVEKSSDVSAQSQIEANTKFEMTGVDWTSHEKNVVLAFSTKCRFCIESVDFYRQLSAKIGGSGGERLIIVSPQPKDEISKFFEKAGIAVGEIIQTQLSDVSINGTPTLVLVNREGIVQKVWVGRLPPDGEAEVAASLF